MNTIVTSSSSSNTRLEAARLQLSELVSKVSDQCLNLAFTEMAEEQQGIRPNQHIQQNKLIADCSIESCLTSSHAHRPQQREHPEMQHSELGLRQYGDTRFFNTQDLNDTVKDPEKLLFRVEKECSDLSMSVGIGRNRNDNLEKNSYNCRTDTYQIDNKYKLASFSADLDLNTRDEPDDSSTIGHLDLNDLSWT